MPRIVVGVIAAVCTAISLGLSSCGDSQPGPRGGSDEGDAGETSRGGASGSGGSEGGGEAGAPAGGETGQGGEPGGGGGDVGGRGGRGGSGGSGGSGGTTSTGGTAQGGDGGNAGGGDGGGGGEAPDQLEICLRLMRAGSLAIDTALAYETAMIADCRVNWTTTLYFDRSIDPPLEERDVFLNNLVVWNLQLWGCNPTAPTDFSLIYKPAPLTSADAQLLIDIYVQQATSLLAMSPPEIAEMRALLDRLSQQTIDRVSNDYSNPDCAGGAGGGGP